MNFLTTETDCVNPIGYPLGILFACVLDDSRNGQPHRNVFRCRHCLTRVSLIGSPYNSWVLEFESCPYGSAFIDPSEYTVNPTARPAPLELLSKPSLVVLIMQGHR